MKIKTKIIGLFWGTILTAGSCLPVGKSCFARVIDNNPVTDQRWIISELYLGDEDYDGAYVELYNNDNHTSLGWKDFVINLPFDIDFPPIYDFHIYKPHAYKKLPLDESLMGWLAKQYVKVMYGDKVFHEIEDALNEQPSYSYQRCQTTYEDGTVVLSNKFYYGKKTPGKAIECDDKSITITNPDDSMTGTCEKLKLNEIGSYMEPEEQFVELINTGNEPLNLSNCYIAKSKANSALHVQMDDYELEPGGICAFNVDQTDLEYIAKTSGILYLIDSDDETVVNYKRYSYVKDGSVSAMDENGEWKLTYHMTPGEENIIEEYPPCPDGQYRDEETHRCRNLPDDDNDSNTNGSSNSDDNDYVPCPDGWYRNPETNRCKKIDDGESDLVPCKEGYVRNPATNRCVKIKDDDDELEPCPDGYYRNPETNRCKKIDDGESDLVPCKEGYVRNPETNRCVKIKEDNSSNSGKSDDNKDGDAKFPVKLDIDDSDKSNTSTTSLLVTVGIIAASSVGILLWQYRKEISRAFTKIKAHGQKNKSVRIKEATTEMSTDEWIDKLSKD